MNATRQLMTDPRAKKLHGLYSSGMLDYAAYRDGIEKRAAELTAETRGQARRRLIKTTMSDLKRGEDQEDMIRQIMNDKSAELLEPVKDDRYYWARGIVNFCETALGWRDRF